MDSNIKSLKEKLLESKTVFSKDSLVKKIILTLISVVVGFYFGSQIFGRGIVLILSFFFNESGSILDMMPGAEFIVLTVISYYLIIGAGVITAIAFGLISLGLFKSKEWKINRYYFIILFPIIILIIISITPLVIQSNFNLNGCYEKESNSSDRNTCFHNAAFSLKDYTLCDNIQSIPHPELSKYESFMKINDSHYVTEFEFELSISTSNCYTQTFARLNLNLEYCEKVKIEARDKCYESLSFHKNNVKVCANINDPVARDGCVMMRLNDQNKDVNSSFCFDMTSPYYKDQCYDNFAMKEKNINLCKQIVDSEKKDVCFYSLVEYQGVDNSACSYINNSELTKRCLSY